MVALAHSNRSAAANRHSRVQGRCHCWPWRGTANVCRRNIFTTAPARACSNASPICRNITRRAPRSRFCAIVAAISPGLSRPAQRWWSLARVQARRRASCLPPHRTLACYVPVDICGEMIEQEAIELRADFPHLKVLPVTADICRPFELPPEAKAAPVRVGFFPGSTIGNFEPHEAAAFLRNAAQILDRARR